MRILIAHSFDSQYEAQRLYSPTGATRNDDDDNSQNASGLFLYFKISVNFEKERMTLKLLLNKFWEQKSFYALDLCSFKIFQQT